VRVNGPRRNLRTGVALAASALVHLLALVIFLTTGANEYRLPEPPEAPPVEVEIERPPQIIPPQRLPPIPRQTPRATPTPAPAPSPVTPQPPKPPQPVKSTPAPEQPKAAAAPLPPAPSPAPPRPVVVKPAPTPPAPSPVQVPQVAPAPAPPAPPRPPAVQAPATAPGPTAPHLNVHKSEKEAPAGALTLPFAPAPTQPPPGGRPPSAVGGGPAAGGGGSRLEGLRPYPPGGFPSGGPGLRGSLVGCANPDAVGLSAVERAHCEARFGSYPGGAPRFDPISPARRAEFDKQNDRAERDRAYRDHGSPSGWTTAPGGGPAGGMGSTIAPLPHSNPSGLPGSPAPQP
jgi:hypothetical protein